MPLHFLNHPWHQTKFRPISPLAHMTPASAAAEVADLLYRAGIFRGWPPGARNADRLPLLKAYLRMPGRGPASRFSDGSFRTVYAGKDRATCIAEVAYHHGLALRDGGEPAGAARIFECLELRITGPFVDVRKGHGHLHRPRDYGPAQDFGAKCRIAGEAGILYRSVRRRGGECLALLLPEPVKTCTFKEIIALRWDGSRLN